MVDCSKRQREIYKGTEQHRCINREAELHLEIVQPDQCAECPVRVLMKQKPIPCEIKLQQQRMAKVMNQLPVIEPQDGYPACPFRYASADGLKCSITNLSVDQEICNRCEEGTREHEAKFGEKIKNYYGAVRRWVANGRPSRNKEEIKALFEEHCKGCDRYDTEKHACKNCGCTVSTDSSPLGNKLAMASEHCPLGRF